MEEALAGRVRVDGADPTTFPIFRIPLHRYARDAVRCQHELTRAKCLSWLIDIKLKVLNVGESMQTHPFITYRY